MYQPKRRSAVRALASSEQRVSQLTTELSALEKERVEAIGTAESCAKTCVRLADMVQLLDKLALEKAGNGYEEAAKAVLQEKAAVKEILDKSTLRSQVNFGLAMKLAEKIGQRQDELVALLGSSRRGESTYGASTATSSKGVNSSSYESSNSAYQRPVADTRPPIRPKWMDDLEAAKQRLKEAESSAEGAQRRVCSTAEESISAALERLRRQKKEDIADTARRVRRDYEGDIAAAQQRLREQEAAMLEKVRRLVSCYKNGQSINEDELELAFFALERSIPRDRP